MIYLNIRNSLSAIPAMAIAFLLIFLPLQLDAQDARLYGLNSTPTTNELWRMDLPGGETSVIKDLFGEIPAIRFLAIDTRNDLMCMISMNTQVGTFMAFDLNTGELKTTVDNLSPQLQGLEFNPVDGLVYTIEYYGTDESNQHVSGLTSINAATGELHRFEPQIPRGDWGHINTLLDYVRNVLWYPFIYETGSAAAVDLLSGSYTAEYDLAERIHMAAFNPDNNTIVGLTQYFDPFHTYDLVEYFPEAGKLRTIRKKVLQGQDLNVYSMELDPVDKLIYAQTSKSRIEVLSLDGTHLAGYESSHLTTPAKWKIHRRFSPPEQKSRVTGTVRADLLNSCDQQTSELLLSGIDMKVEPGGFRTWAGRKGDFVVYLPPDEQYTVDFSGNDLWRSTCPDNPLAFTVAQDGSIDRKLDFLLEPTRLIEQAETSISSGSAVPSRPITYSITLNNTGTVLFNGTLVLCFNPLLTDLQATPPPDRVYDGVAEWDIVNLPIGALREFNIEFKVPADESLRGAELCAQSKIRDKNQLDLLNKFGRDEMCVTVRASLDPNDISVAPRGFGERGMIATEDSTLAYTIRFQNIGDAPARDVVILDTLDEDLDVNTLHFGAASHDYTVSLFNGRILEFRFEGIELPGEQDDEPGSHGMVKFKVDIADNAAKGTRIENRAGIYFDFNKPVLTNTVINTIADLTTDVDTAPEQPGLELRSPSYGLFVLHRANSAAALIQVYNILGIKIHEARLQSGGDAQIDLREQPSGRYLIRVVSGGMEIVRSVAVTR